MALTGETKGALAGVQVLDLSRILAGPFCTQILGDMGADIIKLEQPGVGDGSRAWMPPAAGGESAYYLSVNRNKRSLTVNLKSAEGRDIVRQLAARSDVLVENFKHGELAALGLDYEALKVENPGLVYCAISSYGATGPYRERPGFDAMIQAQAGIMSINGSPNAEPTKVSVAVVDITTGLYAGNAILAALFARERHPQKQGQRVEVSLYECALAWLANMGSSYLISGEVPGRQGNAHPAIVPYQPFDTADVPLALAVGTDAQFVRLCQALGQPELASNERYRTNSARVINRAELVPLLQTIFYTRTAEEWENILSQAGLPVGSINTLDRVFSHPQTKALQIVWEIEHPVAGNYQTVGSPLHFSTTPVGLRHAPPTLGQHTTEILSEKLGYSPQHIAILHQKGVL